MATQSTLNINDSAYLYFREIKYVDTHLSRGKHVQFANMFRLLGKNFVCTTVYPYHRR